MELTKKMIDKIFEEATNQIEYIDELYKIAIPDWYQVVKVNNFPTVSRKTSLYIFEKARDFDLEHHPDILAMSAWMNSGFSTDDDLPDWEVVIGYGDIEYNVPTLSGY